MEAYDKEIDKEILLLRSVLEKGRCFLSCKRVESLESGKKYFMTRVKKVAQRNCGYSTTRGVQSLAG